jgi:hypothetical protein
VLAIVMARPGQPEAPPLQPVTVGLVPAISLPVEPEPAAERSPAAAASPKPAPPPAAAPKPRRPTPRPPPEVESLPAADNAAAIAMAEVGEGELAGAAVAGSGGGGGAGGGCDMTRHLQEALRRDRRVQSAIAIVDRGKALRIWNGDWVLHPGQEGNGLAAVREAIMWEVGFAPAACKRQRMHGLVLISLSDRPGAPRIVVGDPDWLWSDLLFSR